MEVLRSPQTSCGLVEPSPVPYRVRTLPVRTVVPKRPGADVASSSCTTTVAGVAGESQLDTKTLIWVGVAAVIAPG